MKKKNVWIYVASLVFFITIILIIYELEKKSPSLGEAITATAAIVGAFGLIYQHIRARKINSTQFLTTLSQMYINNKDYHVLLDELEKMNKKRGVKLTKEQEQTAANCLDFFEQFYIHLNAKSFEMDQIDDLFCYRFFAIVNNPEVQKSVIYPYRDYYSNIAKLHRDWKSFRKKANKNIPLEETDLSEQSWYSEMFNYNKRKNIAIVGAGLAGCEAALTLAHFGNNITLYEQKPNACSSVYHMPTYSELVCNNSLGPNDIKKPLGLLRHELNALQSCLLKIAAECKIDDPMYFAVDKQKFSKSVTKAIEDCPNIIIKDQEICEIPEEDFVIFASGPLSNERLLANISEKYGFDNKYDFDDASCAVIDIKSIDIKDNHITKITEDLYSVDIPEDVLSKFSRLLSDFYDEKQQKNKNNILVGLQECKPIEKLASEGQDILNQNCMTPHPKLGSNRLLLRRENGMEDGFIIVRSMTTLSNAEQKKAFSVLPGFSKVRFIKYGRMHKNTFFKSPGHINSFYQIIGSNAYLVGQLSGIDGYVPAISSGLLAALHIQFQESLQKPPADTMIGGLAHYVTNEQVKDFKPMTPSYNLIFGDGDNQQKKYNTAKQSIDKYAKMVSKLRKKKKS